VDYLAKFKSWSVKELALFWLSTNLFLNETKLYEVQSMLKRSLEKKSFRIGVFWAFLRVFG
jgi:hypothetical protein